MVTATSATGTCHGPTIWSRAVIPPTVRSPILMRKVLSATDGKCNTRYAASFSSNPAGSNGDNDLVRWVTSRVIFGGLPSNTSSSISTGSGLSPNNGSITESCCCLVATPTTANGQRSRSQTSLNRFNDSGSMASTYRSCDSLLQICIGDMPDSSEGISRKLNLPPRLEPCTSSGSALDRPPAPTSCIERIGLG